MESDARSTTIHMGAASTITRAYPASIEGALPHLTVANELIRASRHSDVRVWRRNAGADALCVPVTKSRGTEPAGGFARKSDQGGPQASGTNGYPTVVL